MLHRSLALKATTLTATPLALHISPHRVPVVLEKNHGRFLKRSSASASSRRFVVSVATAFSSSSSSSVDIESEKQTPMGTMPTDTTNDKLARLRVEMEKRDVSAVLIPSQAPHFSEYVSKCFER